MSVTINKTYYKDNQDPLILVALKLAIETYFYNIIFNNDPNRIVYSTTDYALRRRSESSIWSNALLPFMNYRETDISIDNDRGWASFRNLKKGVYIPDLGQVVRFTPVTLEFDTTLWFATERDINIAYQKLLDDTSGETAINYSIKVFDKELPLYGLLEYTDLKYKPNFDENEWLLSNKISTISLGFKIQTMLPRIDNEPEYGISEKVILSYGRFVEGNKTIDEIYTIIKDRFDEFGNLEVIKS